MSIYYYLLVHQVIFCLVIAGILTYDSVMAKYLCLHCTTLHCTALHCFVWYNYLLAVLAYSATELTGFKG